MTIASKLNDILDTKNNLRIAIQDKGVDISNTTPFDVYPAKINEIDSGDISEYIGNTETSNWTNSIKKLPAMTNVGGMSRLYSGFKGTEIDLSKLDFSNVTNMSSMFSGCSGLINLDLSNFDTSQVTNMSSMFASCTSLISLNVNGWNTGNVTNMSGIFQNCKALTELDVSSFNTQKATSMSSMFNGCSGLTTLNLSTFDMSSATNLYNMFASCTSLEKIIGWESFNFSKATTTSQMFSSCYQLTDIDLGSCDFSLTNNVASMFYAVRKLINLTFGTNLGKGFTQKSANNSVYRLDLSNCTSLTHDSLMSVINNLYDLNLTYDVANGGTLYTQNLKLGAINLAKLTEEEIDIAVQKGWNVS